MCIRDRHDTSADLAAFDGNSNTHAMYSTYTSPAAEAVFDMWQYGPVSYTHLEYYKIFQTAIKATQDAYIPNAQRKRQYLAIYADREHQNEILIAYLIQLSNRSKTASLLLSLIHI